MAKGSWESRGRVRDQIPYSLHPDFSNNIKTTNHKSIRNSVVCLFGVLCKTLLYIVHYCL